MLRGTGKFKQVDYDIAAVHITPYSISQSFAWFEALKRLESSGKNYKNLL